MTILWRGKEGYGDVVSPICYAANRREKLVFCWRSSRTLDFAREAAEYIAPRHENRVDVAHLSDVEAHFTHTNYHDANPLHNVGFMQGAFDNERDPYLTVAVTPLRNNFPLPRGKQWKTPDVDWTAWVREYGAVQVDYRTPVAEAVDILSRSSLCVGYHGSASWLARWCGCPQVVLSANPGGITRKSFTQAVVTDRLPVWLKQTRTQARWNLDRARERYERWLGRRDF